jgi:hypothetical protein
MAIRPKNLDQSVRSGKFYHQRFLGDVTGTAYHLLFVAPFACTVESVELFPKGVVVGGNSETMTFTIVQGTNTVIAKRTTLLSATTVNAVSSTDAANAKLSQGAMLQLDFSKAGGSANLSQVMATVVYKFRKHAENR